MTDRSSPRYLMSLNCPDTKGIVAAVAGCLAANNANIMESNQFGDTSTGRFFMRTLFEPLGHQGFDLIALQSAFAPLAQKFSMSWSIRDMNVKPRLVIAVSKFGHCLIDLVHRWKAGTLHADIACVVSNHEELRDFVEWNRLPYHHLPLTPDKKVAQEGKFREIVRDHSADVVVLARYMQVLSQDFCAEYSGRIVNIHHSFLPAFKGAKPYQQAYERGVKIIGATAHYVTSDLDEGPIIEQAVERVDHAHRPDDLVEVGRDLECTVLARAVKYHLDGRVMLNGARTVVFR